MAHLWCVANRKNMEEKKISEQESLDLISQMIEQTKRDSSIGSGDTFLVWGYIGVIVSLCALLVPRFYGGGYQGWVFVAIPVLAFAITYIMEARKKKKSIAPATYTTKSINSIWKTIVFVLLGYPILCLMQGDDHPEGWTGMFMLCMLLPGIGTYCTGLIMKESPVKFCGQFAIIFACCDLLYICKSGPVIQTGQIIAMCLCMVIALVIPGHYLNRKSKKLNA